LHAPAGFLQDLGLVLCVAALTSVLFQRLRLPAVLGYLVAGVIVGPHLPIPLFASSENVHQIAELGVIVLMFSIGLEFSLRRLVRLGRSAGVIATLAVGLMLWLGYLCGLALGFEPRLAFATGALLSISSTMVASRMLGQLQPARNVSDLVIGITVVEDLFAFLLLAVLTALIGGSGLSARDFAFSIAQLCGFLVALTVIGLLIVPRGLSFVAALGSRETTLVAAIGVCFAGALAAGSLGYSSALGAFIAGALAAESGEARRIELLVRPLRDVFGAVFFVSIGMQVDPAVLLEHWLPVLALTGVTVAGKIAGVTLGALAVGQRTEVAVQVGMSLAHIGEFSFLVASVALALGPEASILTPIAVAVCVLTVILSPLLASRAARFGQLADQRLPQTLRTYLALYSSWLEGARERPSKTTLFARSRRVALWMMADAAFIVLIVVGTSITRPLVVKGLHDAAGIDTNLGSALFVVVACVAALPFGLGIVRCARRLGSLIAAEVLPAEQTTGADLADAPRRALLAGLQFGLLGVLALPVLALTQPFVPALPSAAALLVLLAVAFWALWRSASNLEGHVRAGAAMILQVLASQSRQAQPPSLEAVRELLPGLGDLTPVRLEPGDRAIGHTVQELNLQGRSGASILCISRNAEGFIEPTGDVRFEAGDVLTLAGSGESIAAARGALARGVELPDGDGAL
jgi:CPA2 family monovalent cation:H+ antiporter-2